MAALDSSGLESLTLEDSQPPPTQSPSKTTSKQHNFKSLSPPSPPPSLLFIGLNQDAGCFAAGLSNGFRIYNLTPFRETFRRTFTRAGGGVAIVEMLFRCNLLALVGGGENPRYPMNKVMIWDDHQNRCIGELSFRQEVKAVRLRRDRVVVSLLTRVYVYRFSDLALLDQFNTVANEKGLLALSPDSQSTVLACPSIGRGGVRVELYDARKNIIINAHNTDLGALSLNLNGSRLATASEKGTLIRVFDTATGQMLKELRRGSERAVIQSIAFNCENTFLACSSDKGTVHIFSLQDDNEVGGSGSGSGERGSERKVGSSNSNANSKKNTNNSNSNSNSNSNNNDDNTNTNKKSALGIVNKFLPQNPLGSYFSSEWSYAQVRGIESCSICAFVASEPWTIVVIGMDGSFLRANFREGGEAVRQSYNRFLKSGEDVLNVQGGGSPTVGNNKGGQGEGLGFDDDAVLIEGGK